MEHLIEEAFRVAIQTEKKSRNLYLDAASMMPNGVGREVLQKLAEEERKILERIFGCCPYSIDSVFDQPQYRQDSPSVQRLTGHERRVSELLRLVLHDKYSAVALYETFLQVFREPRICGVFQLALTMSRRLLMYIREQRTEQRRQTDLNLQRLVLDRRRKRTHIKGFGNKPAPNKHSQVFISLQDLGRQSPS